MKTHSNPDAKVFLIGNKLDLEEKRQVTREMALKYKNDNMIDYFTECSAKSGFNAKDVFLEATKTLYRDYLAYNTTVSLKKLIKNNPSFASHTKSLSSRGNRNRTHSRIKLDQNNPMKVEKPQQKGCC